MEKVKIQQTFLPSDNYHHNTQKRIVHMDFGWWSLFDGLHSGLLFDPSLH
jgi:hypothetical protein